MANAMLSLGSGASPARPSNFGLRSPPDRLGTNKLTNDPASGSVVAVLHGGDAAGETNARERQERSI
jgi:hypothetical protein